MTLERSGKCASYFDSIWSDFDEEYLLTSFIVTASYLPIHYYRDVVVDDLQISKVQTPAPTFSPTAATTAEKDEATNAPTSSVSSPPLLICPFCLR